MEEGEIFGRTLEWSRNKGQFSMATQKHGCASSCLGNTQRDFGVSV